MDVLGLEEQELGTLLVILVDLLPGGKDADGSFFLSVLGALVSLAYTAFYLADGRSGPAFSNTLRVDDMALTLTLVIHFSALMAFFKLQSVV